MSRAASVRCAGIVHRDSSGVIRFDGDRIDGPAPRSFAGTTWYADATIRDGDLASLLRTGDEAFGPKPGSIRKITLRTTNNKTFDVVTGDAWGVHRDDPDRALREIRELHALAASCGITVKASAAATAMDIYMKRWDGQPGFPAVRQLPCRWRGMAHAAFHGGPIALLRASATDAVQVDVRRAYLASLYTPLPVLGVTPGGMTGGYVPVEPGTHWDSVRGTVGFVEATVDVNADPRSLPPLPFATRTGVTYPNGRFRGCWVTSQVRDAESTGLVRVVEVHQAIVTKQSDTIFAEIADFFGSLPKKLAQVTYQRFWGKWGNAGGWTGTRREPMPGESQAHGLAWVDETIKVLDTGAARTYRPDIAAFVAADNHRRVMEVIHRDLSVGSVASVHVDAIWTTDVAGAAQVCARGDGIGTWMEKRRGPLRNWSHGCYDHDGDVAASGYDASKDGPVTRERVEAWITGAEGSAGHVLAHRDWTGDPRRDAGATSTATRFALPGEEGNHADTSRHVTAGPPVHDPIWTWSGWPVAGYQPVLPG